MPPNTNTIVTGKQIVIDSFDMGVNCTSDYFAGVKPKYDSAEDYYDDVYSGLAK